MYIKASTETWARKPLGQLRCGNWARKPQGTPEHADARNMSAEMQHREPSTSCCGGVLPTPPDNPGWTGCRALAGSLLLNVMKYRPTTARSPGPGELTASLRRQGVAPPVSKRHGCWEVCTAFFWSCHPWVVREDEMCWNFDPNLVQTTKYCAN